MLCSHIVLLMQCINHRETICKMIQRVFKAVVGVLLIVSILIYLNQNADLASAFRRISTLDLVFLVALSVLVLVLLGFQFKTLSSMFSVRLRFREWFGLTSINAMLNLTIPAKAGLLVRGAYLKNTYRFPFARYARLLIFSHLMMMGVIAFIGLGLSIYITSLDSQRRQYLVLFYSSILMGLFVVFYFAPRVMTKIRSHRMRSICELAHIFPVFNKSSAQRWLIFIVILVLLNILWAVKLQYSFSVFSSVPEFTHILLIQCMAGLSLVISFTPGNLGVKEAVIAIGASLLNIPIEVALIASLIDRATSMIAIFFFGLLFSYLLNRDLQS